MTTNRAATPQARGRANKQRAKTYERDVARILGGRRHLADSGGKDKDEEEMLNDISGKGSDIDPTDSIDREMEDKPEKKSKKP